MSDIEIWKSKENLMQIKKIFAPKITELEFSAFVEMGKATGLNPFLKEIWAVKYGDAAAQIFIGRDGYRKSAQRHPQYDYHFVDAVYSNDFFEVNEGVFYHKYNLKDRGNVVGAYCNVKRKDSSKNFSLFVDFKEYNKGQSVWKEKPVTMIKKVAEAQALRMAFQELLAGTYDESEDWNTPQSTKINQVQSTSAQLTKLPSGIPTYINFGDSPEDKRHLYKLVSEIAPNFNIDPSKEIEILQMICRNVLEKQPVLEKLDEEISKTFYEYKKSLEVKE
jgi:phage recombination protein Bet